ncbi:hypothetical protein ACMYR2_3491 [Nitrobacter sp. TKz-YC01]
MRIRGAETKALIIKPERSKLTDLLSAIYLGRNLPVVSAPRPEGAALLLAWNS